MSSGKDKVSESKKFNGWEWSGVTKEGLNRLSTEDFNGGELSCNHAHMTLWICQTQHKEGSLVYINFL